jgi:Ca2+-transporting ATPase
MTRLYTMKRLIGLSDCSASGAAQQRIMHLNNDPAMAQTMALTVFAIAQSSLALSLRFPDVSVFRRETLSNRFLNFAIVWNLAAMLLVTELPLLRNLFHATPLNARQWGLCLLMSLAILLIGETAKPLLRLIPRKQSQRMDSRI